MASKRETALGALQRQIMTVITAIGMHRKKFSDVFRRLLLLEGIRESHAQSIDRIDRTMDDLRNTVATDRQEFAKDTQIGSLERCTEKQAEAIDKLQLQVQAMEQRLADNLTDPVGAQRFAQEIRHSVSECARTYENRAMDLRAEISGRVEKVSMELEARINAAVKSLSAAIESAAPMGGICRIDRVLSTVCGEIRIIQDNLGIAGGVPCKGSEDERPYRMPRRKRTIAAMQERRGYSYNELIAIADDGTAWRYTDHKPGESPAHTSTPCEPHWAPLPPLPDA